MNEEYTLNPNFEGTPEEAEAKIEKFKATNRWLNTHDDAYNYDLENGGFIFKIPLEEVPSYVLEEDQVMKKVFAKKQRKMKLLRSMGVIDEDGWIRLSNKNKKGTDY